MTVFTIRHERGSVGFFRALHDAHRVLALDPDVEKIFLEGLGHNGQINRVRRPNNPTKPYV